MPKRRYGTPLIRAARCAWRGRFRATVSSVLVAVAVVVSLTACRSPEGPGPTAEAADLVARYLTAVMGDEPDFGWSLLDPHARQAWGGYERYEEAVHEADWSEFSFLVLGTIHCEDAVFCRVELDIPGGPESVPDFLAARGSKAEGIIFIESGVRGGNAEMAVSFGREAFVPGGVSVTPHD